MADKNAPPRNGRKNWENYYKAIEDNELHERFRGDFGREIRKNIDLLAPIEGYFGLGQNKSENLHPWALRVGPSQWIETLNKKHGKYKDSIFFKKSYIDEYEKLLGYSIDTGLKSKLPQLTPHHLISCSAAKSVHSRWKEIIRDEIGYSINCANNLVVLPNIADVACHLSVPLHDGNHTSNNIPGSVPKDVLKSEDGKVEINFKESKEKLYDFNKVSKGKKPRALIPSGYHSKVVKLLTPVLKGYFDKCDNIKSKKFVEDMNKLSSDILKLLLDPKKPLELGKFGEDYQKQSKSGCRNKRGHISTATILNFQESSKSNSCPDCTLKRQHEYLNELFSLNLGPFLSNKEEVEERRKLGLVVASELPFK
ncbi:hypothetical protein G3U99_20565 [Vibrio coralliilyticus OCN008]|uniref:AHH domain-containing protein n=1 Tax=Vibrio coralliilyticus TaxID=190893 RepID=UPI0013F45B5E|nr:AHH domain-containing protein [Vibrio coralliilyticus]QIJ86652.1 hypothetical protein G3U99_20565 [Vibrio coralliilyticus OCN008]